MPRKSARRTSRSADIGLELHPHVVMQGATLVARGTGWGIWPLELRIGRSVAVPVRVAAGWAHRSLVRPDGNGEFVVELATRRLEPGRHRITARAIEGEQRATVELEVLGRPRVKPNGRVAHAPYWRALDFFSRRFGHLGFVPPGTRATQLASIQSLRNVRDRVDAPVDWPRPGPVPPGPLPPGPLWPGPLLPGPLLPRPIPPGPPVTGCKWNPVGAGPAPRGPTEGYPTQPVSGRTISIAIDPTAPSTIYIGTANGGLWKSADGGTTWSPRTDYQGSLAIGALAIDPNNTQRIFAGTGEFHPSDGGLTYYGRGLLRSTDGGNTWTELATQLFERDEITRILFDPTDTTSKRMFLSAATGVYESIDSGVNWTQLRAGQATALVLLEGTGSPAPITLIAGFYGSGLWTSIRTGSTWSTWTQLTSTVFPATFARVALGQSRDNPETIYAAFASMDGGIIGMARTANGGGAWTAVAPPSGGDIFAFTGWDPAGAHLHSVLIPEADLTGVVSGKTYTTTSDGSPPHTHTVTLTTAQMQTLANGTALVTVNTSQASGHTHSVTFNPWRSGQTWYNFHLAAHPTNPNTVYYGETRLWKSTTGTGNWVDITDGEPAGAPPAEPYGIHVDQHALAFDPTDPDTMWACTDGGVFRSTNGGQTWTHRNRDLATLQYHQVAQHPKWEAIMLGGTQDNGAFRYSGTPAWEYSDGGDVGFAAIDRLLPTRMYHTYTGSYILRSDSAGELYSWGLKNAGISGSSEFFAPFILDPVDPNVCYFGGDQLWRSPDNGDTWSAITAVLTYTDASANVVSAGNITAIAVDPSNNKTVYVGTTRGRVFSVQRTGASWTLAQVTTTDITSADLLDNKYISDLAVDSAQTVWVTFSSINWTELEDFSADHVFKRSPTDTKWHSRSTGLAKANPINTIVIDPATNNRLFCGGDVGVFRTENQGVSWTPWDQGLPNAPIFHLEIGPLRLLRAATHGRSVWERPIDAVSCPIVDLYLRDDLLDTGRVQPPPSGVPHPFKPSTNVYWWQSADIKVDGPEPDYQTPAAVDNYVDYELLEERSPRRGEINRFYVQVHNRGVNKATNVQVRAFFANASLGLPALPSNFWSSGMPFTGTPSGTDWTPIGSTKTIATLEAAEPGVLGWDWTVPTGAAGHSCLLAVATCSEDPLNGGGLLDVATLVTSRKHVTLKNLHVADAMAAQAPTPSRLRDPDTAPPVALELHNPLQQRERFDVLFDWGSLPAETEVYAALSLSSAGGRARRRVVADPREIARGGVKIDDAAIDFFPREHRLNAGRVHRFSGRQVFRLRRSETGFSLLPGIWIEPGEPAMMLLHVRLAGKLAQRRYQFDALQQLGARVLGGSTFILRGS